MDIFRMIDKKKRKTDFSSLHAHPRFFFRDKKAEELKSLIKTDPLYHRFYEDILKYANEKQMEITPKQTDCNFGFVWRYSGYLPLMGTAQILGKDTKYFKYISEWINEFLNYSFSLKHPDLPANLSAISTCLIVDWFYDQLPKDLIEKIREKLFELGDAIYEFALVPYRNAWNKSVLQNHGYIAIAALGVIGLTFYEDSPTRCEQYVDMAVNRFSATFEMMGEDGGFHEGFGYWFYAFLPPFVFFSMLKENTNVDFFFEPWFQKVPDYLLFHYFSENHFSDKAEYFSFADDYGCKRTKEAMLRLIANITNHPQLQYLAEMCYEKQLSTYHGIFLNFFWNNKDLKPISPYESGYKTTALYDNYGYLYARSGWDGEESCLGIHCGQPLGEKWKQVIKTIPFFEVGAGHVHPDVGHFILFGKGQVLLRDDEYSYDKKTVHHNTLLINDEGQLGGNIQWFHQSRYYLNAELNIRVISDYKDCLFSVADMKDAYGEEGKLTCLKRYYIFMKEQNCLIVYDKIRAEKENKISANFWPWSQNIVQYGEEKFFMPDEKANLKIIGHSGTKGSFFEKEIYSRYYQEDRNAISFSKYVTCDDLIYSMTFCESSKEPKEPVINLSEGLMTINLDGVCYKLHTVNGMLEKESVSTDTCETTPLFLFSNGNKIDEFRKDVFSYEVEKLPWQSANYLFFTGSNQPPLKTYQVKVKDQDVKGIGTISVENVTCNSYYFNAGGKNAIKNDKSMWSCDQPDDYLLIETKDFNKLNGVRILFPLTERFCYQIRIETSEDGKQFVEQVKGKSESKNKINEFKFQNPVSAKYTKIINACNDYNTFLNIEQIGLF